ncbi:putative ABC transporter permease [Eubacterium sp. CAG:156]|uniref:putative ABC transporter permease n=1 Tax=Eubacterium sp. CAG:156 TaxID=1262880 RepID=UPI00033FF0F4|nr:uncharacterized protein BN504_01086 [Eubacterium sp. CAG:156]
MNVFINCLVFFFIYAFLGWCVEVSFVAITRGKVVNRGFLNGPVCPIYGVGMVGILYALEPLKDNAIVLFIGGVVICSVLELFTGWILDKIFRMRWWDYSENRFNIGGYICLEFSIMWGLGSMIMVNMIHPMIYGVVSKIPLMVIYALLVIFAIAFIIDIIVTVKEIVGFKKSLGQLEKIADGLKDIGDQLKDVVGNSAITVSEKTEEGKEKLAEATASSREKLAEATASSREKIAEATVNSREKIASAYETSIVELKKQKIEMEAKYAVMLLKAQKLGKRQVKAFPKLRVSGSTISVRERLADFGNKLSKK